MRFEIQPSDGPADEAPSVRVVDGPAESDVEITVAATDAKDHVGSHEISSGPTRPVP